MSFDAVLVANRGEIARRVFRTARAMGFRCIAVYVDADAGSPFVTEADEAVRLESGYLDGAAIIAAALATGAGAIHPGYGFLSENAEFAAEVVAADLVWIGPAPDAIEAMGDKLAAKQLAEEAGVAVLASSADPTADSAVGYPLLVKAAAGGGGRGMRIVGRPADLAEAVAAARREAESWFGDDRVFLERYLARAHHVEIQVLGDGQGGLVHLGERECSIQRRHQKIIEESPSPAVDDDLRRAMGDAALAVAGALHYESAGTVEFLLDADSGEFFFLEINTRLQVEHPVTEAVTGIDLVREQLLVALGQPLSFDQDAITFTGHAIEARLYAEDPAAGFLPAAGTLAAFEPAEQPSVRWDAGVEQGSVIGLDFDPLLAKVIAHGPTRAEAAGALALALESTHLGGVTTNRDFLAASLRTAQFLAGDTTTDFIERVDPDRNRALTGDDLDTLLVAAALWLQGRHRAGALVLATMPSGWRNARLPAQTVSFGLGDDQHTISYACRRDGSFSVGSEGRARIHAWTPTTIDLEYNGRRGEVAVAAADDCLHVHGPWGHASLTVLPRFAAPGDEEATGGLVAPMPGSVVEVRVAEGERVEAGQILMLLEAMKMEHQIKAPFAGTVRDLAVAVGDQVENGAVLLVIHEDEANGAPDHG